MPSAAAKSISSPPDRRTRYRGWTIFAE